MEPNVAASSNETLWRLEKTPRTINDLVESLCQESSGVLVPFGEDLENVPLGTRLDGGECFRRLLCFRFEVEYTSLPLGAPFIFLSSVLRLFLGRVV